MTYDVTVGFSNGAVRSFTKIKKIEYRIDRYNGFEWKNIINPLDYKFNSFGYYKLTSETESFYVFTSDSGSYILSITFFKVRKSEN